ncbi:E3 ubiquitin-protein ligase UBR2-like [Xenia sp. Carnegie-2017]|uniref:E3 ubiquitin-protein ligase UBR2-like n=1 Tax=Xenia sp. Carnegie-2017 TaxID=2897299 RepID=UPI001F035E86|nr:E3 ubiquitin-protein ligase UBR2-like [Xenia sp. Carnegie-2017]
MSAEIGLRWRRAFEEKKDLKEHIELHLKEIAVRSYAISRDPVLQISLREELVQHDVFDVLEWFVFGDEPDFGKRKLADLNQPPSICGKIFKTNEPTYSCRDCAVDGTCVLCMACFEKSIHKNHNYRLYTSAGGGCCDCGDVEAWKQGAACEIHAKRYDHSSDEDLLKILPQNVADQARFLFNVILDFCVGMICDPNRACEEFSMLNNSHKDSHVVMLYNDESHTFQGVITALQKVIPQCSIKLGKDIATVVDREGRSSVYFGPHNMSLEVSRDLRKHSRGPTGPLRCEAIHINVVAYQLMAFKLMEWLSTFIDCSDCLRRLHADISTTPRHGEDSYLAKVLCSDAKLWKVARFHTHQLFMHSLLKDSFGKRALAIEFTKNYSAVLSDFLADDQDHSISASSLSVQIFTVPSLVQMLAVNCDLLEVVIDVLLKKTSPFLGDDKIIDLSRDERRKSGRLYYVIHDLRYILQNKPSSWTDSLKMKFYNFLERYLNLLQRFQEVNMIRRATSVHVEIEPEWHLTFDFAMRLSLLTPHIMQWCGSHRDILIKSIAITLKCLRDVTRSFGAKKHREGEKTMTLFNFDVSSEKVSVHIPIVRFLAGLIGCCAKYSLDAQNMLEIKGDDDLLTYMAYPLKVLVFAAQVKSGMWRRNGFSVQHQIHAYCQDTCACEMYDKDIFFMQVLASCMDKEHFFLILLDMFQLTSWASESYSVNKKDESTINQQLALAAEFLHLLIILLGERYNSTIGIVDKDSEVRREIIHRLCLGDVSRSELFRGLSFVESEYERRGEIDGIINSVATFKKPARSGKGIYKLKKECLSEFNPYFYHYTKNLQSKAEDYMKKRCKEEKLPEFFAPPAPVDFLSSYSSITKLLISNKMIQLFTILIWRIKKGSPRSWTDRIFHEILYLICLGLCEEKKQRKNGRVFGFVSAANARNHCARSNLSLFERLKALQGEPIVQGHSSLLCYTIQKFREQLGSESDSTDSGAILPQPMDVSDVKSCDTEKIMKRQASEERRKRVLQQMANMQKAFIKQNSDLYLSTETDVSESSKNEVDAFQGLKNPQKSVIGIGNNRDSSITVPRESLICILCQASPNSSNKPLVSCAFVQRSTVLSDNHHQDLEEGDTADPLLSYRDRRVGVHVGSCGHVMHGDCWVRFFESILTNERLSLRSRILNTFDLTRREFLCPLCSGLSNTVLPLVSSVVSTSHEGSGGSYTFWYDTFQKIELRLTPELIDFCKDGEHKADSVWKTVKEKIAHLLYGTDLSSDMTSMITVFTRAAYMFGLNVEPDDENSRVSLIAWATCAYTIQCHELTLRESSNQETYPKREFDMIKSLVSLAGTVSSISKPRDVVSHCIRLFSVISGSDKVPQEKWTIVNIDVFDWMVKMRFTLPSLDLLNYTEMTSSRNGDGLSSMEMDGFVFHFALTACITQILLTTSGEIPSDEMDDPPQMNDDASKHLANLWRKIHHLRNPSVQTHNHPNAQRLMMHIKLRLLPFLRCCVIFFHILNSTRIPLALRERFHSFHEEYDALATFLAIPRSLTDLFTWNDLESTFNSKTISNIVERWCTKARSEIYIPNQLSFELSKKLLIQLPKDFSVLINQASQYECPVFSGIENSVPALCLICGAWCCCEGWCCREVLRGINVGSCTAHASRCGAGIGIFLRVQDCRVVLLNGIGKGCFHPSPYLDAYGETDPGLRRGNPLYLCEDRFEKLRKLWSKHGVCSEIVRTLESNRQLMQIDWASY